MPYCNWENDDTLPRSLFELYMSIHSAIGRWETRARKRLAVLFSSEPCPVFKVSKSKKVADKDGAAIGTGSRNVLDHQAPLTDGERIRLERAFIRFVIAAHLFNAAVNDDEELDRNSSIPCSGDGSDIRVLVPRTTPICLFLNGLDAQEAGELLCIYEFLAKTTINDILHATEFRQPFPTTAAQKLGLLCVIFPVPSSQSGDRHRLDTFRQSNKTRTAQTSPGALSLKYRTSQSLQSILD
jgi:hypothetical protein